MHVSVVPIVIGALVLVAAAVCLGNRRQRRNRRWADQWEELVRSQPDLDRELDEVSRRFSG